MSARPFEAWLKQEEEIPAPLCQLPAQEGAGGAQKVAGKECRGLAEWEGHIHTGMESLDPALFTRLIPDFSLGLAGAQGQEHWTCVSQDTAEGQMFPEAPNSLSGAAGAPDLPGERG